VNICSLAGRASTSVVLALVFVLAGSIAAFGQQITGSIVGTVKDPQGAVVNTATVKATNLDTGFSRSAPANGYGEYRIDYLPVGRYTVDASAAGFEHYVQQNVALDVDQELTVDITLSVGAQTQTVTVTEAPPLINTSDAVIGRTIEADEIVGLPLVNRNIYTEISITPGVMANNQGSTANPTGSPNMTVGIASTDVQINGGLDAGNGTVGFYLDGGNNITGMRNYGNPAPNPDAIEEFRVETSAFSAQYGQFSAAVVSVITKSGTNKFHGSLFEFNRNTDFNAWQWGAPNLKAGKAPYHRNQFGGTVGGPIKHDKAFFFFSYAGLRQVAGAAVTGAIVPSANERLGDFTADTSLKVYNPKPAGTSAAVWDVPANQVMGTNSSPNCVVATLNCINTVAIPNPANPGFSYAYLDPTAKNILNVTNTIGVSVPLPNNGLLTTGGGNWVGVYVTPTTSDEYLGKFDENLGDKDHVGVTYFHINTASTPSGGGNVNWTGDQSKTVQTNANISEVHTFSPSTANQAWLTLTRAIGGRILIPVTGPQSQTLGSFGSNFQIQGPASLPYLTISGDFNTGNPNAGPVTGSNNYELRDVVSVTKGKHNLSLGGEFALDQTMFVADLNNYGDVGFASSAPTSTGNALADFVAGQTSSFEQDTPYVTHLSTWHTAVFAQDNYRITPRFTANLGLRWDIDTPPVDAHDRTASFVPNQQSTVTPSAPKGLLFVGDAGVGRGIISTEFSHISPRLGFAWDPFGDGKTSVRAAAGIFYGIPGGNEWNQPGNGAPFALRESFGPTPSLTNMYGGVAYGFLNTNPGGGIFPYTYTPAHPIFIPFAGPEAIATYMKYPSVYQFNLSVQRELPARITLTTAYVGTLGRNLATFVDENYAPYSTAFGTPSTSAASVDARRQYDSGIPGAAGTLSGITYLIPGQTTNFNSLQVSATKTMSRGFTVSGFYVWSRALESANFVENGLQGAQDFGVAGKPFTASNNSMGAIGGGLQEERGLMAVNHDSNAAISGMWNIDYVHGNKIMEEVANGWSITSVALFTSGAPFSMSTGSNNNFDSANANRPNAVPGVSPILSPHRCRVCAASANGVTTAWFNKAAFTPNGPGAAGGIGPGGADGNVGPFSLNGPGLKNMDAGLLRNVKFERGMVFQFRAEITNVMNWVNLSGPTSSLSSGNDGKITGATGTQRVIQLGGRLTF
jgi:hypothetical protein